MTLKNPALQRARKTDCWAIKVFMRLSSLLLIALMVVPIEMVGAQYPKAQTQTCLSLHKCAELDDAIALKELLRQNAALEAKTEYGETPLFTAVRFGQKNAISFLISAGAKIDAANNDGTTPLMMAVLSQDFALIKQLVEAGANVNAKENNGDTVLMHGVMFDVRQTVPILYYLASQGAEVDAKNNDGMTALMLSPKSLAIENVECLLALGANVTAKDKVGKTAIDYVKEMWAPNLAYRKIQNQMKQVLLRTKTSP